ncbi:uncharacterized protein LOC134723278 [Mytilus trossulus]|uniref:uncharacterized protein LOC134723278 n=1 Tax=Mytilus trossulus TaxID=6551 RepID=UPI003007BEC1
MKLTLAVCVVLIGMVLADNLVQSVKMMHQNHSKSYEMKNLESVFNKTDKNHDGHITVDELIQHIEETRGFTIDQTIQIVNNTIGLSMDQTNKQDSKMVFGNPTYDLNENGTIELNEYAEFMRKGMKMGK